MVVLPLVPVIPTTVSSEVGSPLNAAAIGAIAALRVLHLCLGHVQVEGALEHQGGGPGLDRPGSEVVAVGLLAGEAEEQGSVAHPAAVIGQIPDLHRAVAADLRSDVRRSEQLAKLHPGPILGLIACGATTPRTRSTEEIHRHLGIKV